MTAAGAFDRGLALIRAGEFFAAHEELELAWRAAPQEERDFFQGLVHVAVAWYQAGRGNRVGCERQLAKALRRLGPYAPSHRSVDVASLLGQVTAAAGVVTGGSLELPALDVPQSDVLEEAVEDHLEPPVAVKEEENPEPD
jgi:predicted metal-dependent hydrolase